MANSKSAKKRARQAEKRRQHNVSLRSRMRSYLKVVLKFIEQKNQAEAEAAYEKALPILDGMVNKGFIHKNNAARRKSRLVKRIRALSS